MAKSEVFLLSYQALKDGVEVKTVVFVPSIRGGILVRRLREREETLANITGFGIKFEEAVGTQLLTCLMQT